MQGIRTSRQSHHSIRAVCDSKTIIVTKDPAKDHRGHHLEAAIKLATAMEWYGKWVGGTVPGVDGMVWLPTDEDHVNSTLFHIAKPNPVPTKPEDDDIITSDNFNWFCDSEHYFRGTLKQLEAKMDMVKFWPNVWRVDDHGGHTLILQEKNGRQIP